MAKHIHFLALAGMGLLIHGAASAETLQDALNEAYQTNPQLEAQRFQTKIADESINQAKAQGRTQVGFTGSAGYQSSDSNSPFSFGIGERPLANAQLQASRPIYTGGRVKAGIRQAYAGLDSAKSRLNAVEQDLYLQVVTAYVDVRRAQETVKIRKNNVAVLEEQVRAANDRFEVGVITRTDVALSGARLEGARAALAGAQSQLEASIAQYSFLTGQVPEDLAPPPPLPPFPESFEAALELGLANSPDIEAARHAERAANEAIKVAEAAGRPQISIVGVAGYQETFDPSLRNTQVQALARGSVPIFQGGLIRSQVRSAKLQRQSARQQILSLERQVRAQVAQAWYGYQASVEAIEASKRQVDAAEIAYKGAQDELSVGVRTTLDVLDQEQQLFDARLAVVNAERDAYVAAHSLLRAVGGLSLAPVLPN